MAGVFFALSCSSIFRTYFSPPVLVFSHRFVYNDNHIYFSTRKGLYQDALIWYLYQQVVSGASHGYRLRADPLWDGYLSTYTSPDHLKFLYEQNRDRFDAFLFGGSYPFEIITGTFGPIQKPCAYFNVSDRDYYKMIACLAVQEPNLDFQRVYFDIPDMPVDFRSIFQRENIPLLSRGPH